MITTDEFEIDRLDDKELTTEVAKEFCNRLLKRAGSGAPIQVSPDWYARRFYAATSLAMLGDREQGLRYITTAPCGGCPSRTSLMREDEGDAVAAVETASANNLPFLPDDLVGRKEALTVVAASVGPGRLVTLIGPGGVGKTRLALAVGERLKSAYPDGVWWVDLAPVCDPALVAGTVARAVGLQLHDAPALPTLVAALETKRLLLILDNCEHVIGAAAELADALRAAGGRLLATSQAPLGIAGEHVLRLPSLAVPPAGAVTAIEALRAPAVQLFAARARAWERAFVLDDDNAGAAVRLCRWLEGVPLALELAARRAALLGIEAVARRLDERLLEMSAGRRDIPPRHQTLRALLEWSHGMLSAKEQVVLRRMGNFIDGCTLEEAGVVIADMAIPVAEVASLMGSLVAKSLVLAEETSDGARYRLLETTRAFARKRLDEAGEGPELESRRQVFGCPFEAGRRPNDRMLG